MQLLPDQAARSSLVLGLALGLLREGHGQAVEGVLQAGLVDGLQARLAAADARALVLVVRQANVVLVRLRAPPTPALSAPSVQ